MTVLQDYDADDSGRIEADEVDAAKQAFHAGDLGAVKLQKVAAAHQSGTRIPTPDGDSGDDSTDGGTSGGGFGGGGGDRGDTTGGQTGNEEVVDRDPREPTQPGGQMPPAPDDAPEEPQPYQPPPDGGESSTGDGAADRLPSLDAVPGGAAGLALAALLLAVLVGGGES